jgi:hypothetical protein
VARSEIVRPVLLALLVLAAFVVGTFLGEWLSGYEADWWSNLAVGAVVAAAGGIADYRRRHRGTVA